MIKKKYTNRISIDYRILPWMESSEIEETFKKDIMQVDKYIRFKMKTDYIKIGYDAQTCFDLMNTKIKELLYAGTSLRSVLSWENNLWYLYKYESIEKLFKALKINVYDDFQVTTISKHIEIMKIYKSNMKHSKYDQIHFNPFYKYKYPTRIFGYRKFIISPVTKSEYETLKDLKQPFIIQFKQYISAK